MSIEILNNGFYTDVTPLDVENIDPNIWTLAWVGVIFINQEWVVTAGCKAREWMEISFSLAATAQRVVSCISSDGNGGCKINRWGKCANLITTIHPEPRKK